jgi:hypothetical protein
MSSLALYPKFKAFDPSTGSPLAGGKLYTYAAGTTTAQATYSDSALTTPNANPIILDANGEAVIYCGALSYKFVLQKSDSSAVWAVDNYGPNLASNQSSTPEWIAYTGTTAFVNTTTFQVTGADATATFTAGRRVRTSNTGGTVYSTVSSSTYSGGNTSVILINDGGGVLDSGFSAPCYGIVSYANPSYLDPLSAVSAHIPANVTGWAAKTQITSWTEDLDALSEFTGGTFTALYPGKYLIEAKAQCYDTTAGTAMVLTLNQSGTDIAEARGSAPVANYVVNLSLSRVAVLAAGDTIKLYFTGSSGTTLNQGTAPGTLLNIVRIR